MKADGDGCNAPEANTTASFVVRCWRVCRGPQGVAGMERSAEHVGDPGGACAPQGAGKPIRPEGGRLKTLRESDQLTVLRESGHEGREQTMPTSLQGIAKKAAHDTSYRFRHLFGMLTVA